MAALIDGHGVRILIFIFYTPIYRTFSFLTNPIFCWGQTKIITDKTLPVTLANLLALAGVCPFVGSLSDLFGRRYIALIGASLVLLGMIIVSTAQSMNIVIGGMVFAGVGAGINELTALAAASEMSPVAKRGKYISALVFTITPFCLSALYAQMIAAYSTWRYVGLFCALWNLVGLIMTALFYFPPPRVNPSNLSKLEILRTADLVGGFLSISGLILFSKFAYSIFKSDI